MSSSLFVKYLPECEKFKKREKSREKILEMILPGSETYQMTVCGDVLPSLDWYFWIYVVSDL